MVGLSPTAGARKLKCKMSGRRGRVLECPYGLLLVALYSGRTTIEKSILFSESSFVIAEWRVDRGLAGNAGQSIEHAQEYIYITQY